MRTIPAELTNMVMIEDKESGTVVVQRRRLSWTGLSFPGGHLENGESFSESAVREIREETGLTVSNLSLCGLVHWCRREDGARYLVALYKTSDFSGQLLSSTEEGAVFWMKKEDLLASDELSPNFRNYLSVFFNDANSEAFACYGDDFTEELRLF